MSRAFTVVDAVQRSPEWFVARVGRLTGSRAGDMLAAIKSGEAAARRDYRLQLVTERLTQQVSDDVFVNAAMQRGIDVEPLARAAYERETGELVQESGFLRHDAHMAGCSLDGHVGDFAGIVELKCPKSATHLRYLRTGALPAEHVAQVTHNLWVSGAQWCDFASYDDRFPDGIRLCRVRVMAADLDLAGYEVKALAFLAEVETEVEALRTMTSLKAQLVSSLE